MSIYITVLKSDKRKAYLKSVQWANTLTSIVAKKTYKAGVSMSVPKGNEAYIQDKVIVEEITQLPAKAEVYRIEGNTAKSVINVSALSS